jgi:hypothetical protein
MITSACDGTGNVDGRGYAAMARVLFTRISFQKRSFDQNLNFGFA